MRPGLLFICGSLNQTTMLHRIAGELAEFDCFFTPFYADGLAGALSQTGLLDFSILGGWHFAATRGYLEAQRLPVDFGGRRGDYDAVVTCTDLLVQKNIRGRKLILVQEGITEPDGLAYRMVRSLGLPRWIANTAATGLSNAYDVFCVASEGYRDFFASRGVKREKMAVTGIPNFDNFKSHRGSNFPLKNYVLVATSSVRETGKPDDRRGFLRRVRQIAGERTVVFKLHPNENADRARKEIRSFFPDAPVYLDGDVNAMIANCDVLITQYSSVVYAGLALGKEVHSSFDLKQLRRLLPAQNGGSSARHIAEICREVVRTPLAELRRVDGGQRTARRWRWSDAL